MRAKRGQLNACGEQLAGNT